MKKKSNIKIILLVILVILLRVAFDILLGGLSGNGTSDEPEVNIIYEGKMEEVNEEEIPDNMYYPNLKLAMKNADIKTEEGEEYQRDIDEIIKTFENDRYITIYFRSVKNKKEECFRMAKFKKKEIDGEIKYCYLSGIPGDIEPNAWVETNTMRSVKGTLSTIDFLQGENINPEDTIFLWGICWNKSIYSLKIDNQPPDEIIPIKVFDRKEYLWYYENFKSKKAVKDMKIEIDEK